MKIKDQNNRATLEKRARVEGARKPEVEKNSARAGSFRDLLEGKSGGEKQPADARLAADKESGDKGAMALFRAEREDNALQNDALRGRQHIAEKGDREQLGSSLLEQREVQKQDSRDTSHQRLEQRHEERISEHRAEDMEARSCDSQDSSNPAERTSISSAPVAAREEEHSSSLAAENARDELGGPDALGADQKGEVAQAASPEQARRQEVVELANKLVRACQVGTDQQARKVMMLDVRVPGRGSIRVRLRQEGNGISVRMRADNDELKALLRKHQGAMRDAAHEQGVTFSRIDVV
jgi:hypothetical protein